MSMNLFPQNLINMQISDKISILKFFPIGNILISCKVKRLSYMQKTWYKRGKSYLYFVTEEEYILITRVKGNMIIKHGLMNNFIKKNYLNFEKETEFSHLQELLTHLYKRPNNLLYKINNLFVYSQYILYKIT